MLDYYTLLITITPQKPSLLSPLSTMISQITINQPSVPPPILLCIRVVAPSTPIQNICREYVLMIEGDHSLVHALT